MWSPRERSFSFNSSVQGWSVSSCISWSFRKKTPSFAIFSCCWETISCFWASWTAAKSSFLLVGFKMKEVTWYLMAVCAYSKSAYPVRMITFVIGWFSWTKRATSSPSAAGILISVITISTGWFFRKSMASIPSEALPTTWQSMDAQFI